VFLETSVGVDVTYRPGLESRSGRFGQWKTSAFLGLLLICHSNIPAFARTDGRLETNHSETTATDRFERNLSILGVHRSRKMPPNSFAGVFRNANHEKEGANDHQKTDEYKSSAGTIGRPVFAAHM
jgi:hypothetical protein